MKLKEKLRDGALILGLLAVTAGLLRYPRQLTEAGQEGVRLCLEVLIPSLFPFFVLSSVAISSGLAEGLGRLASPVMERLFRVSGQCAGPLILGLIGGYPVGARAVTELYSRGAITKTEAERMLAFSNNSGPAFILGVVGSAVFLSTGAGLMLYLCHAAASLLIGVLFRFYGRGGPSRPVETQGKRAPLSSVFVESVASSFMAMLRISGFVTFFTVLIRLIFLSGMVDRASLVLSVLLPLSRAEAESLITGFIELTGGVWSIRQAAGSLPASMALAAFMLGWAGLCVHCQVISFISQAGLSSRTYMLGKALHGLISALLTLALCRLVPLKVPVSLILAEGVRTAALGGGWLWSGLGALGLGCLFLIAKRGGKSRENKL